MLYDLDAPPFPSPADAGWLAFYPCAYLCLGLRLRASAGDLPRSAWLDGLVGILAVGALGVSLVIAPVLAGAEGSRAAVLTNAAYPLADLLLLGLTVAVLVLHGRRAGRAWALLAAGFGLFAFADSLYFARLAADTYSAGTVLDSLWVLALVIMALASWQPLEKPREIDPGHLGVLVPPVLFSLAALGLLVYAGVTHVPAVAVALAGAAVLAATARTALTVREIRGFHEARRQAATDELTGLPNRREFGQRLRSYLARANAHDEPLALLIIDIDRFKELNDALGHHAGDAVLAQIGPRLRSVLRNDDDVLARLGGDEFAVLLPGARSPEDIGRRIARALEDRFPVDGIDVQIAASVGIAVFEHGENADHPHAPRRRRDVPGQDIAQRTRLLRPRAGPQHARTTRARRPAPRRRRPRPARRALPADHRPRHRHDHRRGGTRALATPRARPAPARRLRAAGRADRRHAQTHRPRTHDRTRPGRALAQPRTRHRRRRQRLGLDPARARLGRHRHRRAQALHRRRPGGCASRSPRTH